MGLTVRDLKDTYDRWWLGVSDATAEIVGWFDNTWWEPDPDRPGQRRMQGEASCPLCGASGSVPCPVAHKHMRPNTRTDGYAYYLCPVCDNEPGDGSEKDGGTITCGYCGGGDGALAEGPLIIDGVEQVWKPDPNEDPKGHADYLKMVEESPYLADRYGASTGFYPYPPHKPEGIRKWSREKRKWVGKVLDPYDLVDTFNAKTSRNDFYDPDNPPPPEWDLEGEETPCHENQYAHVPPGWYRDPENPNLARFWNGGMWIGEPADPAHIKD